MRMIAGADMTAGTVVGNRADFTRKADGEVVAAVYPVRIDRGERPMGYVDRAYGEGEGLTLLMAGCRFTDATYATFLARDGAPDPIADRWGAAVRAALLIFDADDPVPESPPDDDKSWRDRPPLL